MKFLEDHKESLSDESKNRLVQGNALRILDSKQKEDVEFLKSVKEMPQIDEHVSSDSQQAFEETLAHLKYLYPGVKMERDPTLVRGLDYYNGTCFEIKLDEEQSSEKLKDMESKIFG